MPSAREPEPGGMSTLPGPVAQAAVSAVDTTRISVDSPTHLDGGAGPVRAAIGGGAPDRVDRYVVLRELGRGGMGVVYAAYDETLDRKLALKLLRDSTRGDDDRKRMVREARALARLSHPNIVNVYEVGEVGGRVYLAMELVEGVDLRTWLGAAPRTQADILAAFLQAAEGLAAAHAAGLVHRDFKPDNVIVGVDGRVRVMDFGLARLGVDEAAGHETGRAGVVDPALTAAGTRLGTPAYMAPEQYLGIPVDAVADVYGFAVSLYEAVHGARPFQAASSEALAADVLRGRVTHVPQPGRAPAWLQAAIARGMAVEPGDRWPTMRAFAAALRADPRVRVRRALAVAGIVAAGLVIAAVLPPLWHALQVRWQHERVEALADERLTAAVRLQREGDAAAAEAAFTAFVAADEHRGTRALARAWLQRGQAAWSSGQVLSALDSLARSYVEAGEPADAAAAMRTLAEIRHARWELAELGPVLDALAEYGGAEDPSVVQMRVDEALARADFAAADLALAAPTAAPALAAMRPWLAALAVMRPLGVRAEQLAPVVGEDGQAGYVLASDVRTRLTRTDAAFRPLATQDVATGADELVIGRPAWFTRAGDEAVLMAWTEPPRALWRGPAALRPALAAWLDVGDGGAFYLGGSTEDRGFRVLRAGSDAAATLVPAHTTTNGLVSDIEAMLAADLDGDGDRELVVSVGPWCAFDLRVFAGTRAGLELLEARSFGRITALATIRDERGVLLAALKDDRYPTSSIFPASPHTGEPAGVYLLRWTGARLEQVEHLPLPNRDGMAALAIAEVLLACDVDGDGRTDLVAEVRGGPDARKHEQQGHAVVFHRRADGGWDRGIVGVTPLACTDVDGDPADELIVHGHTPDEQALWALGAGDVPVPVRQVAAEPATAPAWPTADPLVVDRWARVDRLVTLGLASAAVDVLVDTATLTADPQVEQAMLVRAAGLRQDAGAVRAAVGLYGRAERRLALPGPTAVRVAEAEVELGEVARADTRVRALVGRADVDDETRAAAAERARTLAPLLSAAIDLDFTAPMDPAWQLDPLALRRDRRAGVLHIDAVGSAPFASLPVRWDGGAATLAIDLEVTHRSLMAELRFVVVDAADRPVLGVGVVAQSGTPRRQAIVCWDPSQSDWAMFAAVATLVGDRSEVRAQVLWDPARGTITCNAEVDGVGSRYVSRNATAVATAGPATLTIDGTGGAPSRLIGDLRALSVRGVVAAPGPAAQVDPRRTAAWLLVEGRPAEALRVLAALQDSSADVPLWRFLGHDALREQAAATAAMRDAAAVGTASLGDGPIDRLLAAQPDRVGPPLRAAIGPKIHRYVVLRLYKLMTEHAGEALVEDLLLSELPWIADLDEAHVEVRVAIRMFHARALAATGRLDEARVQAAEVMMLMPRIGGREGLHHFLANEWILLTTVVADAAPDDAIAYAEQALRVTPAPEMVLSRLRNLPEMDVVGADPRWLALVGPGR